MNASQKRRPGRPPTRTDEGPSEHVGFRASKGLKEQLEAAAAASGRSLSTEAQFRLERSFAGEDSAGLWLLLAGLDHVVGHLGVVAAVISHLAAVPAGVRTIAPADNAVSNWLRNGFAFDQACEAITLILEALRPEGDRWLPQATMAGYALPMLSALPLLVALVRPEASDDHKLRRLAEQMRRKLGPEIGERVLANLDKFRPEVAQDVRGVLENAARAAAKTKVA
jgi:TraY domain